jgi:hypothetical protein
VTAKAYKRCDARRVTRINTPTCRSGDEAVCYEDEDHQKWGDPWHFDPGLNYSWRDYDDVYATERDPRD